MFVYDDLFIAIYQYTKNITIDIDPTSNMLLKYNGQASIIIYSY